jgi:hypothetical protein
MIKKEMDLYSGRDMLWVCGGGERGPLQALRREVNMLRHNLKSGCRLT